jgi:hypothetical protein
MRVEEVSLVESWKTEPMICVDELVGQAVKTKEKQRALVLWRTNATLVVLDSSGNLRRFANLVVSRLRVYGIAET